MTGKEERTSMKHQEITQPLSLRVRRGVPRRVEGSCTVISQRIRVEKDHLYVFTRPISILRKALDQHKRRSGKFTDTTSPQSTLKTLSVKNDMDGPTYRYSWEPSKNEVRA